MDTGGVFYTRDAVLYVFAESVALSDFARAVGGAGQITAKVERRGLDSQNSGSRLADRRGDLPAEAVGANKSSWVESALTRHFLLF